MMKFKPAAMAASIELLHRYPFLAEGPIPMGSKNLPPGSRPAFAGDYAEFTIWLVFLSVIGPAFSGPPAVTLSFQRKRKTYHFHHISNYAGF